MSDERESPPQEEDDASGASGRDKSTESEPTASGHSTADSEAVRNQEDESPG